MSAARLMKPKASLKFLNSNFRVIASRPSTSRQPESFASAALRASAESFSRMAHHPLLAEQRIGRLDHIRPAAGGRLRGEQHETRNGEGQRAEQRAAGEIVGHLVRARFAQARERDMR